MIDLDALAHAASSLDPLPASLSRLAGAVSRDIPDVDEITEVVGFDEALTATLLRAANSSWSASREPITTVRAAVVRLGSGTVLSMALGGNVRARMHQALPEFGLEEGDLWRHSVAVALAAELMPRFVRVALPAEVVTAGLLHDFGKLLMARFLDDGTLSLLERARAEGGRTHLGAEEEILGVNHAELGGLVVQSWGLPDGIVRGITYHHTPAAAEEPICYATYLANVVAKIIGAGGSDGADPEAAAHAIEALGISAEGFDRLCELADERFAEVSQRYS